MTEYGLTLHTAASRTLYHFLGDPKQHRRELAAASGAVGRFRMQTQRGKGYMLTEKIWALAAMAHSKEWSGLHGRMRAREVENHTMGLVLLPSVPPKRSSNRL